MSEPVWLRLDFIDALHDRQIAEHGGASGLRDEGLLESAVARPRSAHGYGETDLAALASFYAGGLIKNYSFMDGNKRSGYLAAEVFLALNGVSLTAPDTDCLQMTLALAAGEVDEPGYAAWLRGNCEEI